MSKTTPNHHDVWLLDYFPRGSEIVLWFVTADGERLRATEAFAPAMFVDRESAELQRQAEALERYVHTTPGLEWAGVAERRDFWTDQPRPVFEIRATALERASQLLHALERHFPDLVYYNCDILPEIHYGYARGLYPTAHCRIHIESGRLAQCEVLDSPLDTDLTLPPLREARLEGRGALAGPRPRLRALSFSAEGRTQVWEECRPHDMLLGLRDALATADPDIVRTSGGDGVLIPVLLGLAEQFKIDLGLDREREIRRRLDGRGRSFISYGQVLYHAPDYPLFGRWHIDDQNSFWASQTGLDGLIEVARMSKIPLQRAARRSIGTGISSIELDQAWRDGYLIPWKKSQPEAWKSAATLLKTDRGGLVYQPLIGVYENVVELDFVSMYPSIMVTCNVSPETINCACCPPEPVVPEIEYSTCRRRRGLVPRTLEAIIAKRREYKRLMKAPLNENETPEEAAARRERYKCRQEALKWLLVCCFGYLGYRNARFGRIEAHEATCAWSREKLLQAREICEARGWRVIHAIVDCVWIQPEAESGARATAAELEALCDAINAATGLTIALEGRYRWLAFLPSRMDPEAPVPNRYFGLFEDGKLKFRGIELRRSDQAPFAQAVQAQLLEMLRDAESLAACAALRDQLLAIVRDAVTRLRNYEVPLEELLLKRKTSRAAEEYKNNNMTAVAARQAARCGIELHPGQAVRFIVTHQRDIDPDSRVRILPLLRPGELYDPDFYIEQVRRAAATILEPLLGKEALDGPPARTAKPTPPTRRTGEVTWSSMF